MNTNLEQNGDDAGRRGYAVKIDDQVFHVENPEPTGRELLELVGRNPADFFLVFVVPDEPDWVVEVDEPFDLTKPGTEEFILVSHERHFSIQIDESEFTVTGPFITGQTILDLVGKSAETHFVTQIIPNADDIVVGACDKVDLSKPGRERFTTVAKPCSHQVVKIDIDGHLYDWNKDTITTEELIDLGHLNPGDGVIMIDADNNERTLAPGEVILLTEGVCFGRKVRFRRG